MLGRVVEGFRAQFGGEPDWASFGPGRLNLIGEHTDYNDGFVFPAAIDRGVSVAARRTKGPSRLFSAELGPGEPFDANVVKKGEIRGWARYPASVAAELRKGERLPNLEAWVDSTLPTASGLSSSAAIELAFATLWNRAAGLGMDNRSLAVACQRGENEFVGMPCGVMDQMASALGREGHALFLDTRSLHVKYAPVPAGVSLVVCDTGKRRELTSSAYAQRRSECARAATIMGKRSLRDCSPDDLEMNKPALGDVLYRRGLHVLSENQRCVEFYDALTRVDLARLGTLLDESHMNLRNNFEVSCIELDSMVHAARESKGCIGARMTGAGFGGACVALVETPSVGAFIVETGAKYLRTVPGLRPEFIACEPANGAFCQISGQTISNPNPDVERE